MDLRGLPEAKLVVTDADGACLLELAVRGVTTEEVLRRVLNLGAKAYADQQERSGTIDRLLLATKALVDAGYQQDDNGNWYPGQPFAGMEPDLPIRTTLKAGPRLAQGRKVLVTPDPNGMVACPIPESHGEHVWREGHMTMTCPGNLAPPSLTQAELGQGMLHNAQCSRTDAHEGHVWDIMGDTQWCRGNELAVVPCWRSDKGSVHQGHDWHQRPGRGSTKRTRVSCLGLNEEQAAIRKAQLEELEDEEED